MFPADRFATGNLKQYLRKNYPEFALNCARKFLPVQLIKRALRSWYRNLPRTGDDKIRWWKYFFRLTLKTTLWFLGLTIGITLLYSFLPIPYTPLMAIRSMEQSADPKREQRCEKDWVGFDDLSPYLQLAVVCAEDQNYFNHHGFDFEAIEKAVSHNQNHKRKRGASTISQQTAKNVFLWPNRSWIRKGLEVYFTFLIETIWSKKRIMTVYLNVIEFGDGIYGAEAAAQRFFRKSAKRLSREEAALLAAVLPRPLKYSASRPSTYVRSRQHHILEQMRLWGNKIDFDNPITPGTEKMR